MDVWGRAFERLDNPSKIIMFHQKLVRWVKSTHNEYERRLAHTIKSLRAHVWGSARQYTFVVMEDTEIDSKRHDKMVERFKTDHPCFDIFELTGQGNFDIQLKDFAPLEERPHKLPLVPTLVVLVHAYMRTFVHAHPYPQSHTLAHMQLEIITARRASKMWDALSSAEKSSHPPAIQKLFADLVLRSQWDAFARGDINPKTGCPWPTRHAGGEPTPELEQHLYNVGGVLLRGTSIDGEQKFSMIRNYTTGGATNASLERITAQLSVAEDYPSEVLTHTQAHTHTHTHTHIHTNTQK